MFGVEERPSRRASAVQHTNDKTKFVSKDTILLEKSKKYVKKRQPWQKSLYVPRIFLLFRNKKTADQDPKIFRIRISCQGHSLRDSDACKKSGIGTIF